MEIDLIKLEADINALAVKNWNELIALFPAAANKPMPKVVCFLDATKYAGWANCGLNEVRFNLAYAAQCTMPEFEETIVHELAHHVVHRCYPRVKQAHGKEFRYVMQSMFYNGNTYHSMSRKVASKVVAVNKDAFDANSI